MTHHVTDLSKGSVGAHLVRLTLPMIIGIFSLVSFNLADTYFVSRLGVEELAALSFTFPVVIFIGSISMGLGTGVASVLSRLFGQSDIGAVKRIATDSLIISLLLAAVLCLAGVLSLDVLFVALGARGRVLELVKEYMRIWYLGMFFFLPPIVGNNAIRAAGDTVYPGIIMLSTSLLNVVLDPVLIFGLAGFPPLGVSGAALATVLARAVSMFFALYILYFKKHLVELSLPSVKEFFNSCLKLFHVGLPAAATNILLPVSMGVVTRLAASFGKETVAGLGAGVRVDGFVLIPLMALSSAIVPFVGQNWGAKRVDRVCRGRKYAAIFSLAWGMLGALFFQFYAPVIAREFSDNVYVSGVITSYLSIVSLCFGFEGITMLSSSALNALGKPLSASTVLACKAFVFYLPCTYLGTRFFGITGLLAGACLGEVMAGTFALVFAGCSRQIPWWPGTCRKLGCSSGFLSCRGRGGN